MRGLIVTLALGLLAGAAWAAAEARDSDQQHHARIAACVAARRAEWRSLTAPLRQDLPIPMMGADDCGRIQKGWDQQGLILAAVLAGAGVLALALAARSGRPHD